MRDEDEEGFETEEVLQNDERMEQKENTKGLLDINSASEQAGYSPRHFRRIMEENNFPIAKFGHRFFVRSDDVAAWQNSRNSNGANGNGIAFSANLKREPPPTVAELTRSYRKEMQTLRDVVGKVFGVDLQFHSLITKSTLENFNLALGVWAFLLVNDFQMHKHYAATTLECSVTRINRYLLYVERKLVVDQLTAQNVEKIRLIISGKINRQNPGPVKKLSSFRDQNLRTELSWEAKVVIKAIKQIILRVKVGVRLKEKIRTEPSKSHVETTQLQLEKQTFQKLLEQATSVSALANKLSVKPQELLVKCRSLGLTDQLRKLLQKRP